MVLHSMVKVTMQGKFRGKLNIGFPLVTHRFDLGSLVLSVSKGDYIHLFPFVAGK